MAKNVKSVEKKLDIVIDFLSGMQGQLTAINSKLDALQDGVTALRAEMRRLAGRPVLEVFENVCKQVLQGSMKLPSGVYVQQSGVVRGPHKERAFEVNDETNARFPLMKRCKTFFTGDTDEDYVACDSDELLDSRKSKKQLMSSWNRAVCWNPKPGDRVWVAGEEIAKQSETEPEPEHQPEEQTWQQQGGRSKAVYKPAELVKVNVDDSTFDVKFGGKDTDDIRTVPRARIRDTPPKSLLLVHGVAGIGNSVVSHKMHQYLCGEFYDKRKLEGITVVPIFCNLPALANPLTDLVGGTLRAAPYNLRDTQIAELLALARGECSDRLEVVFVLDGYDELRPQFLWKNMFLTNNLDQYRDARALTRADPEPVSERGLGAEGAEAFSFPKVPPPA